MSGKTFSVHLLPPGEYVQRKVDTPCGRGVVPCFFSLACLCSKVSMPGRSCLRLCPSSWVGVKWHSPTSTCMDTKSKHYLYSETCDDYGHLFLADTFRAPCDIHWTSTCTNISSVDVSCTGLRICPEMHENEIHELYERHHKVSPTLNSY